jgi:hypothetical protein
MFRKAISIGININKRFCHHHSKAVFEPQVQRVFVPQAKCKQHETIEANTQQITKLEGQIDDVKNKISYIYLLNMYIVPIIVFLK